MWGIHTTIATGGEYHAPDGLLLDPRRPAFDNDPEKNPPKKRSGGHDGVS